MLSVASSAGIDVGKQYLDVGFFPAAKPLRVVNEPTGIAKIVSVLRARGVGRVVLEAVAIVASESVMQTFLYLPVSRLSFLASPGSSSFAFATASKWRAARLSQLTSARIKDASIWTISPVAIFAAIQAFTVFSKIRRNSSAPHL